MDTTDFFADRKPWSKTKHDLLEHYLRAYITVRKRSQRVVYYIDGFAGAGAYAPGTNREVPGSPRLIAKLAQEWSSDETAPGQLRSILIEKDQKNANSLAKVLADIAPTLWTIKRGDFGALLPEVLGETKRWPAFFFLDPIGIKTLPFSRIAEIATRSDTELLILLDTSILRRLGGFDASTAKGSVAKADLVDHVLGDAGRWRDLLKVMPAKEGPSMDPWIEAVLSQYCNDLRTMGQIKYAHPIPIRPRWQVTAKYHLIFATRHSLGLRFMNDLVCSEEDHLTVQPHHSGQLSLGGFTDHALTERAGARRQRFREDVLNYLREANVATRNQMISHLVDTHFGQLKTADYTSIWGDLEKHGFIEEVNPHLKKVTKKEDRPFRVGPSA